MNIKKITINGHYVWVDRDAKIKEGDLLIYDKKCIRNWDNTFNKPGMDWNVLNTYKIIAVSPELNLEGVPSYVEYLAEHSSEVQEATYTTQHKITYKHGFIDGYRRSEKELFTEDDVKTAIELAKKDYLRYTEEQIIEHLKELKK